MNDPIKNILIGLFVFAAGILVVFVILFLHPTVGDDAQTLRVRFANIDKVSVGTRVTYGGKPVGEVVEIRDIEDQKDARKAGKDGFVYIYELVLQLDSKVNTYNTDQVSLRTSGLLGEKSVEITPQAAKPGQKPRLVTEEIIYANETGSVEETLKEFKELSDKIEATLDSIKFAVDELNRRNIWEKISDTAENLRQITGSLNKPEKWTAILDNIDELSTKLIDSVNKFDESIVNINQVSKRVASGEGSAGKILMRDDLYLRMASFMNKAETVVDDIAHYGILFQNDKRWQKMRARRANLITRLECPQEFRNYFNDELDEIAGSLGRISMVLQDSECMGYGSCYMDDCEFRKVFAELLRRVKTMEESLEMYNEQVVDRDLYQTELYLERN